MKPKVFASTDYPDPRWKCVFLVSVIGILVCRGRRGGGVAKLMCKYFHKFIFYSVKFGVSCLKTYKKFAQLIRPLSFEKKEVDVEDNGTMRKHVTSSQFDFCGARKCFCADAP